MKADEKNTREYIIDMLAELCVMAHNHKQEDILPLLSLSYQAITNRDFEPKTPISQR